MSEKNLQAKLAELESLVSSFDEKIDIEQALKRFETGARLAEEIEKDLKNLKTKITVLKERFDKE
jgi:exodeoxyribonuclease VII small subunit